MHVSTSLCCIVFLDVCDLVIVGYCLIGLFCYFFLFFLVFVFCFFFFFQAEDGIRDRNVTGVQTCGLPIFLLDILAHFILAGWMLGVTADRARISKRRTASP